MKTYFFVNLLIGTFWRASSVCDTSTTAMVDEGNFGQSNIFSWLGVLRVHLHDGENKGIAVTGLVLIKQRHALVNADDVTKIPQRIFNEDTRVMFIAAPDEPWFCRPKSYSTHPEYGYSTQNTIAVLELDLTGTKSYPMRPICWPDIKILNTSTHLYAAGYTDENQLLEKSIYKVQYTEKTTCAEFYDRAGLANKARIPVHYICAFSPTNRAQCVWENGMVLITNATGYFSLAGFGIRGPGCAAPARFIDLQPYREWIQEITSDREEVYYYDEYRRVEKPDNIPVHEMFKDTNSRRQLNASGSLPAPYQLYPFDTQKLRYFNVEPLDNHSIAILPFNETMEFHTNSCDDVKTLLYREDIEIKGHKRAQGYAYYKISLYDLTHGLCTCAYLTIDSDWRSEAIFTYKEFMEIGEGGSLTSSEETPEKILKDIVASDKPDENSTSTIGQLTKPSFLQDIRQKVNVPSYDLYVQFRFKQTATMKLEMYGIANFKKIDTKKKNVHKLRDMAPPMTVEEERMRRLRQRRIKLTKPPGRKMWYNKFSDGSKFKSGYVEHVPDAVSTAFSYINNVPITVAPDTAEGDVPSFVVDTFKPRSTNSPEPFKDYSYLLRFSTKSPKSNRPRNTEGDSLYHSLLSTFKSGEVSERLMSSFELSEDVSISRTHGVRVSRISFIKILFLEIYFSIINV